MVSRVLVWVAVLLVAVCAISGADDVAASPLVVRLKPTDRFGPLKLTPMYRTFATSVRLDVQHTDFLFKAEPAYSSKAVVRGVLYSRVRKDGTKEAVGFAWDRGAGVLYVDANRDLDLTNDPEAVFRTTSQGPFQYFQACALVIEHDGVPVSYLADFEFYGTAFASARLFSGWRGAIEIGGKKYCLEVQDGFTGEIDEGGQARMAIQPLDSPNAAIAESAQTSFPKGGHVVLDGHEYAFAFAIKDGYVEARITEVARPTGELRIEGQSVKFVLLDGPARALIDNPGPSVRLPVGSYRVQDIYLYGADAEDAYYAIKRPAEMVTIAEDRPASLRVGGPLKVSVLPTRRFGSLLLTLETTGIGGEVYLPYNSQKHPAKFSISSGGRTYCEGTFAYG